MILLAIILAVASIGVAVLADTHAWPPVVYKMAHGVFCVACWALVLGVLGWIVPHWLQAGVVIAQWLVDVTTANPVVFH